MPGKTSPAKVLLLVEIADTSLKFDTKTKAPLYARLGVRETWVINAMTLTTRVHRQPSAGGYASIVESQPDAMLTPGLVPSTALRLNDLGIELE